MTSAPAAAPAAARHASPWREALRIPRAAWLVALALLALRALALVATTAPDRPLNGDEPNYHVVAHHIAAGDGIVRDGKPWVLRPPGWPLLLAGAYTLFGEDRRVGVALQGVLDAITIVTWSLIALALWRSRMAAALMFGVMLVWPPFLRESRWLQTEPPFTTLVALLCAACMALVARPGFARGALVGVVAAAAVWIRPPGLLVTIGLVIGWLVAGPRPWRRSAAALLGLVLGLVLALAPLAIRNTRVLGRFLPVSVGSGDMLFVGTLESTGGRWDQQVWRRDRAAVLAADSVRLGRAPDLIEADRALLRETLRRWADDPGHALRMAGVRLARLVLLPFDPNERPLLRGAFLAVLIAMYVLAIPAAWRSLRDPTAPRFAAVLALALEVFALLSSAFYTNSRYFEPLRPMVFVLAIGTIVMWRSGVPRSADAGYTAGRPAPRRAS